MKHVIAGTLVLLSVVSFATAQRTKRAPIANEQANATWPAFFKSFRDAVGRRDRAALKPMMVSSFFFSGGSDENGDGDTRDEAFKFLDDPQVKGWRAFAKVLAKGAVPSTPNPDEQGNKFPSRVAPPEARRIRSLENAPPWVASFEFRNGKWYCTSFSECCD